MFNGPGCSHGNSCCFLHGPIPGKATPAEAKAKAKAKPAAAPAATRSKSAEKRARKKAALAAQAVEEEQ